MGRLAPGTSTNIHPRSGLAPYVYAQTVPAPPPIPMGRMTLAAACASGMRHVPMPTDAERCGCYRCRQ
jgi:hypothetical protein